MPTGNKQYFVLEDKTQEIKNKTINADNNTISNLETDNFKEGVIDTNSFTNDNSHLASSKLVKEEIASAVVGALKFKGFVSDTQPTNAKNGNLWYNGTTLPITNPIQVKEYNGTSWSELKSYTITFGNAFLLDSDDRLYFYDTTGWRVIDALGDLGVDNITIGKDASSNLYVKDQAISTDKLKDYSVSKGKIDTTAKVVYEEDTQTLKNKTLDIDNNTLSNVELDNFKDSALIKSSDTTTTESDTNLLTAKKVKDNYEKKIVYSNTTPTNTDMLWVDTAKGNAIKHYNESTANWVQIGGGNELDNVTLELNSVSGDMQVKEGGLKVKHIDNGSINKSTDTSTTKNKSIPTTDYVTENYLKFVDKTTDPTTDFDTQALYRITDTTTNKTKLKYVVNGVLKSIVKDNLTSYSATADDDSNYSAKLLNDRVLKNFVHLTSGTNEQTIIYTVKDSTTKPYIALSKSSSGNTIAIENDASGIEIETNYIGLHTNSIGIEIDEDSTSILGTGDLIIGDSTTSYIFKVNDKSPLFGSDVINTLDSDETDKPLSAKQGKKLQDTKLEKTSDSDDMKFRFKKNAKTLEVVDEDGNNLSLLLFDAIYPVGSIYLSTSGDLPSSFNGTWEKIADGTFLMSANGTTALGATGGEAKHTLTTAEMPSHTHTMNGSGSHNHYWEGYYTVSSGSDKRCRSNDWIGGDGQKYTSTVGNHTHTINANGSGAAHNNLPPYLAVSMWKRTA